MFTLGKRMTGSNQVAEDIVQEVFLKIWKKRKDLRLVSHFDKYLLRMVYNEILNLIQRKTKESQILNEISSYQQNINYEDVANTEYESKYLALKNAIEDLPTRQKLVFILSKEKGLKQEEIANELNISLKTVKSHMTQALNTLRLKFIQNKMSNIDIIIVVLYLSFYLQLF